MLRKFKGERIIFLTNGVGTIRCANGKKKKNTKPKLTPCTNTNLKFIIPLNRGPESRTLLEKKAGEICDQSKTKMS